MCDTNAYDPYRINFIHCTIVSKHSRRSSIINVRKIVFGFQYHRTICQFGTDFFFNVQNIVFRKQTLQTKQGE